MNLTAPELNQLQSVFPDRGEGFLESAGLSESWVDVLSELPDRVRGQGEFNPWRVIIGLRDFWTSASNWRAAYVGTQILLRYHQVGAGLGHPNALMEQIKLGLIAAELGNTTHAKETIEPAWIGLLAACGSDDVRLAPMGEALGDVYLKTKEWDKARAVYEMAYAMQKGAAPEEPAGVSVALSALLMDQSQWDEAVPFLKESIEWFEQVWGHDDAQTLDQVQTLVALLGRLRRIGEAVHVLDRWHNALLALPEGEQSVETRVHMGIAFHTVGRLEEALRLVKDAVRWTRTQSDTEGVPHVKLAGRLVTLANLIDQRGHQAEAEGLIRESLDVEQRIYGEQSGPVCIRYSQLADYLSGLDRGDEAAGWYEVAVTTMVDVFGVEHVQTQGTTQRLVECLLTLCDGVPAGADRQDRIVAHLGRARHWSRLVLGPDHALMNRVRNFEVV